MFEWLKRWMKDDKYVEKNAENIVIMKKLDHIQHEIQRWHHDQTQVLNQLENLKISVDYTIKEEMHDIQGRYIKALEDKLVRFDEDINELRKSQAKDRSNLHDYFYSRK